MVLLSIPSTKVEPRSFHMRITARTGLVLSLMSLLCASLAQARGFDDFTPREPSLKQSGHWEWAWDGTDGLGVGVPATVHYVPGGPARIIVTGPDEILERLRVGQGQIKMPCDNDCHFGGRRLDITVSGVALHSVALAGSGEIQLGRLDQDRLKLAIMGSGWISAEGRIDRVELAIMGSGDARLGDAAIRQADIHIAGSGNAILTPREEANIHVAGSGNVRMTAMPVRLNQIVAGSGGVRIAGN
jgi:hypothetical protein